MAGDEVMSEPMPCVDGNGDECFELLVEQQPPSQAVLESDLLGPVGHQEQNPVGRAALGQGEANEALLEHRGLAGPRPPQSAQSPRAVIDDPLLPLVEVERGPPVRHGPNLQKGYVKSVRHDNYKPLRFRDFLAALQKSRKASDEDTAPCILFCPANPLL